jgi:hypothetical protein
MAATSVRIVDATPAPVAISMTVRYDARHQTDVVRQHVSEAVSGYLAFAAVDFGQTLYSSDVFALVEAVPGVIAAEISQFNRTDVQAPTLDAELAAANLPALEALPEFVRVALEAHRAVASRIEIGPYEVPTLESLDISMLAGPA